MPTTNPPPVRSKQEILTLIAGISAMLPHVTAAERQTLIRVKLALRWAIGGDDQLAGIAAGHAPGPAELPDDALIGDDDHPEGV